MEIGEESKNAEADEALRPDWIEAVRVGIPLLWFIFAVYAFQQLSPLAEAVLKQGGINTIKIGIIELQLEHVAAKAVADPVEIAKDPLFIPKEKQKQISERFARMSENIKGATLLWVDDKHPYQNVPERRVFVAANINVDLANSTGEAMKWLSRSKYDVIITDMDRPDDKTPPPAPCEAGSNRSYAGCALLKMVGDCFRLGAPHEGTPYEPATNERLDDGCVSVVAMQKKKLPALIVYSAGYPQDKGVPYRARVTNKADELFGFVLDALEQRHLVVNTDDMKLERPPSVLVPVGPPSGWD
jgi:hypothetical protein